MGFPQLQAELRWYPHRRKRTPNLRFAFTNWADLRAIQKLCLRIVSA